MSLPPLVEQSALGSSDGSFCRHKFLIAEGGNDVNRDAKGLGPRPCELIDVPEAVGFHQHHAAAALRVKHAADHLETIELSHGLAAVHVADASAGVARIFAGIRGRPVADKAHGLYKQ